MAYPPEIWDKIDERLLLKECPSEISKSLGGKPSEKQIRRRREALDSRVKTDPKMSKNVRNILRAQHDFYEKKLKKFEKNLNDLFPNDGREVVAVFKDWREVYFLRKERSQTKKAQSSGSVAEKLKNPEFLNCVAEAQKIQSKIDELGK